MLWWLATKTYVRPDSRRSRPWACTVTPVVARISHDQARAQRWAKYPRVSNRLEASDAVPRTIVYTETAGIRKKTVRHQWNGGTRTYWPPPLPEVGTTPPAAGTAGDAAVSGVAAAPPDPDSGDEEAEAAPAAGTGTGRGRRGGPLWSSRSPDCAAAWAAARLGSM